MSRCKVYLAGPMRGYPQFNFPAFFQAEEHIRRYTGWDVINPARLDVEKGFDPNTPQDTITLDMMREFARRDFDAIMQVGAIVVLPGWERSKGARAEVAIAEWIGLGVWRYPDMAIIMGIETRITRAVTGEPLNSPSFNLTKHR